MLYDEKQIIIIIIITIIIIKGGLLGKVKLVGKKNEFKGKKIKRIKGRVPQQARPRGWLFFTRGARPPQG